MIPLNFTGDETETVKQFVYDEMERISPHLKRIIRSFYDLNWGEGSDDTPHVPQIDLSIPFHRGLDTGASRARVFNTTLYSDSEDECIFYIIEWVGTALQEEAPIAQAKMKFSDWIGE